MKFLYKWSPSNKLECLAQSSLTLLFSHRDIMEGNFTHITVSQKTDSMASWEKDIKKMNKNNFWPVL